MHQFFAAILLMTKKRISFVCWLVGTLCLYSWLSPLPRFRLADDEMVWAMTPDGKYLATSRLPAEYSFEGRPGPILLRSASDGRIVRQHAAGAELINFVQFAPDSQSLVACCDKELNAWSISSGELIVSNVSGYVHSLTFGQENRPAAVMLKPAELERGFFRSLASLVDLESGASLGEFGPTLVWQNAGGYFGVAQKTTLRISDNGRRAITYQNAKDMPCELLVWDLPDCKVAHTLQLPRWHNALAISPDGNTLVALYQSQSSNNVQVHIGTDPNPSEIHFWDLVDGKLRRTIKLNRYPEDVAAANIANATYRMNFLGRSSLVQAHTAAGPAVFDTKGDNFRFVSTDTLGHVVSPDGRFYAEEDGEYVSPGVLYWPVKSNRQLCIRRVSDDELVANVKSPDLQATMQAPFKPICFSPDGSQLLYQEYADPTWGSHLSSFLSDPLHPKLADRAQGLCLVDSQTGERSLEIWPSKRIWGGGIFFPDGKHLQVDREVWAVPWSRPWFRILGIPIVVVGLIWMPEVRRWRRKRSETRLE